MTTRTGSPYDVGQLILVNYPFTDQTLAKLRPAVVVSSDAMNRGGDFVALPLTSATPSPGELANHVAIHSSESYFPSTKLKRDSYVKWMKPLTLNRTVVRRKLGCLPGEVMDDILAKVRSLFEPTKVG